MPGRYIARHLRPHYIAEWLAARELSQVWLANQLDTDKANVTRWIKEPRRVNLDILSSVADALDLEDAGDLLRPPDRAKAIYALLEAVREVAEKHTEALPPRPAQTEPLPDKPAIGAVRPKARRTG